MAKKSKVLQNRLERKYNKLVADVLEKYKDKTMGELWEALDNLKAQMKEELDAIK